MPGRAPVTADPLVRGATATKWDEARERLAEGETFWLATSHADGRPHVRPVLAVWLDDRLYFSSGEATRKARNLARDPRCVLAVGCPGVDLVVEGEAARVVDEATLRRVADVYASKYGWHVTVRDGAFDDAEGAPTAGPPPFDLYEVAPTVVFGFATDATLAPTRWRF